MADSDAAGQRDDALKIWIEATIAHPTDQISIHSLQNDVLEQLKNGELPLKRAINQTLAASTRSQSRATEAHLRALVVAAVSAVDGFAEAFAGVFKARAKSFVQSFASARLIVLRLSCALVETAQTTLADDAAQPAWMADIAKTHSALLEAMLKDSDRAQALAHKTLLRLLRKYPSLVPVYVAVLTDAAPELQQYALWLVLRHLDVDAAVNETLWKMYAFWAFDSKARTVVTLKKNDLRFKGLTIDQFDALLKPTVSKVLKKSPDSALEAVIELVRAVPLDLGVYLGDVFNTVILAKLKSTKEDVRVFTVSLARELLAGFHTVDHFASLVTQIAAMLDGKHGLLAQFYMREAAYAVLADAADAIASLGNSQDAKTVAVIVIPSLVKALEKEAHDQARHLGLLALGKWLAHADEIPNDVLAKIQAALKNKSDAVVAGYLRALAVFALQSKSGIACLAPVTAELTRVIVESNKKPAVAHLDGVLALGVAGALALSSSEFDQSFTKDGVVSVLLDVNAFVATSVKGLMNALAVAGDNGRDAGRAKPEVTALVALAQSLSWVLSSKHDDATAAYRVLVDLLTSSVIPVRKAAESAINSLFAASLDHVEPLLVAFERKLNASAEQLEKERAQSIAKKPSTVADDAASTLVAVVPPAGVLRRALRVVLPSQVRDAAGVRESAFPRALVLAHHPFVVDGRTPAEFGSEWNTIKQRFLASGPVAEPTEEGDDEEAAETVDDRIDNFIEAHEPIKEAVVALLTGQESGLLFSALRVERLAAQRALASLLNFAGNGEGESIALHDVVEEALIKRLDAEEIGKVTEEDAGIYETPFDELYVPTKNGGDGASRADSQSRRAGGGRRGNEDEQWEQQVREELERKKAKTAAAGGAGKKLTPEEKAQLAQQQARRVQLHHAITIVDKVVEAVDFLGSVRPDEIHPALPHMLRSLVPLFQSCLFDQQANDALNALAKSILPAMLREHASDVAGCLRIVLRLQQDEASLSEKAKQQKLATHNDLFVRTLASLMDIAFGFQFDTEDDYDASAPFNRIAPPTLHLVSPVLSALINYDPELRRWTLPLFAAHAHMIPEEEEEEVGDVAAQRELRKEMLELVLRVLAKTAAGDIVPITNSDLIPAQLLANLCEGPALSLGEWAPLLGDSGLLSESADVRHACLKALLHVAESEDSELSTATNPLLASRLFVACFDVAESNRSIAKHVWELTESKLTKLFAAPLLVLLNHAHTNVRESASLAIADGMTQFPETMTPIINNLKAQFQSHLPKAVEDIDAFGNPTLRRPGQGEPLEEPETYTPRCGVSLCLEKVASSHAPLPKANVVDVVSFVIEHGLVDPNGTVRAHMRKTGIQVIDAYGGNGNTAPLLQIFEQALDKKPTQQKGVDNHKAMERYDHQREGIVVCLGALAKHMDKTDPKVASIVDSLVDALSIPSESVQRSVATCLAPLIPAVKDRSAQLLTDLLTRATTSETFGERIGAAFGVSAVVKGLGISALKQHDIIPRIEDMMKAGGANARQGAMLIFECLSARLGLLFEPYIIVILPIMLKCFADASPQVRDAASETSKKIMANLSAHGVKLVLPSLLRSLEDGQWRTKQAGIQLLGSMAYCAPRQLGSCLPQVVPKITAALTDSHPKVRDASKGALRDVGSVVRNPEIASISSSLLNALEEPNKYTNEALQQLQSTSFQHSIDAPSLALVMPIITRGLKDRAGDAKKKSALIVGQMCTMINDAKDLAPYMEMVLPSLKTLLMDPIPEVRAVSAKAMGKLVKGLGESHFSDILTWLLEAIKGDFGSVERSGAAQGLCEVLVALGKDRVESTLFDEIFPLSRHPKYSVREGVLWIIAFLPPALGKGFAVFIGDALPIIVSGLSDEADSVRDVAMHAGHVVVNAHALSHTRDILPSLEAGLFDDSWRIRQSSVTLLGDLMYRISGTRAVADSGAAFDDNDDGSGSAAGDKAIIKTLGMERRNAILSSLYMIRSDTSAVVRQSSLQVWKSVVANTPKTLRQILPTLMGVIVGALSGDHIEKQTMAGRTLGEIVRKLGENVLPEIVPILRDGLTQDNSPGKRQGACVGLAEVIECCNKRQLEDYVTTLVDAVLDGLCDELPLVRASAAQAFDVLQRNIGYRAIDETVPALLHRIKSSHVESQSRALNGLQEIMRVKAREVLPYLMPRLLTTPLSLPACRAVSRVAQATGATIHFHLEKILLTFVPQYLEFLELNATLAEDIKLSLRDVVLAVQDVGVHSLAVDLCKLCEKESVAERSLGFYLIGEFCGHTATTYHDQAPLFLRQIVTHLNDPVEGVVKAASDALKGMNATLRPEEFAKHVDFIRQGINSLVSDARHRKGGVGATGEFVLPGLAIPKGLEPFLPSYQYALMNGSPELRQTAAAGLGELVQFSSAAALRPYLIKLTGPLIRIAGDRFPGHVKAAILHTLEVILEKGGVALKPFLPQLQTTFVKALNDTASEVRAHGTSALSKLVALSPRIDPLVAELTEKVSATTGGIREANLDALTSILQTVGDKVSPAARAALEDAVAALLDAPDDDVRERASKCLAQAVATDSEGGARCALQFGLATGKKELSGLDWARKQSAAAFLELVLAKKHQVTWLGEIAVPAAAVLAALGVDEHIAVRSTAVRAIAALVKLDAAGVSVDQFVPILAQGIAHANKDVSKTAAKIAKRLAKRDPAAMRTHVATLVPPTFALIKSNNIAAKLTAERALLYLLEVQSRPETLEAYVRADAANGKIIGEYARRVLAKLKADSGDESE